MTSLAEFIQTKRELAGLSIYGLAERASIDIEILEVYPGTKYNDTCISEIIILNVPQPFN